jgi:hypothetical protein
VAGREGREGMTSAKKFFDSVRAEAQEPALITSLDDPFWDFLERWEIVGNRLADSLKAALERESKALADVAWLKEQNENNVAAYEQKVKELEQEVTKLKDELMQAWDVSGMAWK